MRIAAPLFAVAVLSALGLALGPIAPGLFGIGLPIAAAAIFFVGFAVKVLRWARTPVPFAIPTTCGQQKSLAWIRQDRIENPSTTSGVVARMALEVLAFRSLFRNVSAKLHEGKLSYLSNKWLWAAALAFHWSLLIVLVRHLRFFTDPVPAAVVALTSADGFFQVGLPAVLASTMLFLGAGTFLLARRLASPALRYLSLPADWFALFLLLAIGFSGAWMRHVAKIDVPAVKEMILGLRAMPLGAVFYAHLTLVSALLAYFPFSKLMHMPGVFLSPTRNLTANSREVRHVNPWNPQVEVHTYAEYEAEFGQRMKDAGIPTEHA